MAITMFDLGCVLCGLIAVTSVVFVVWCLVETRKARNEGGWH